MKILYLHPRAWTGEYPVLAKLRSLGHEVCVLEEDRTLARAWLTTDDFERPGDSIPTFWYNPRYGLERLLTWPLDRLFRRAFDGRNLGHRMWVVRKAAMHFAPDVIACTDGFTYAIPVAFLRRLRLLATPLVVSYIGGDILDCPEAEVGKRRTPMVTWLLQSSYRGIDVLRPLCASLAGILSKEGAPADRIAIVPIQLGVEVTLLAGVASRRADVSTAIRRRYGIPDRAPLVVTLSGNHRGKGLHVLASIWPAIVAAVPDCHWLLCGPENPWLESAVWPLIRKAGLAHTVRATGSLTGLDVYEHLAAADLHVNPTLCEGLNMVTVEAAVVGTPTVGTDGAGISDWLHKYHAGTVVPAGDADRLADATIAALNDPARLAAWSKAGREMTAEFTLDRIAAQLISLFERARAFRTEP